MKRYVLFALLLTLATAACKPHEPPTLTGPPPLPEIEHVPLNTAPLVLTRTVNNATTRDEDGNVTNPYADRLTRFTGTEYTLADLAELEIGDPRPVRSLVDTSNLDTLKPPGLTPDEDRMFNASVHDARLFHSGMYLFDLYDDGEYVATAVARQAIPRYGDFTLHLTNQPFPDGHLVTSDGMTINGVDDPGSVRILDVHEAPWEVRTTTYGPVVRWVR